MLIRCNMPIIKTLSPNDSITISIWKIDESLNELKRIFGKSINIKNEIKLMEHIASRLAIKYCCEIIGKKYNGISKDNNGKPTLNGLKNGGISISHKYPYAVGMINLENNCGVDVERVDKKIRRIQNKFLNNKEMKYVGDDIKGITKIWSVKESSYKVGGETIPLNKINVKREGDNLFKSEVGNKSYSLNTIELNGHVISYTT
ncbi:MAG: hypothetical protein CMB81_01580 [Flammeovirgaceae bacterium]|nr:hypothetical protein [Flammeovirgaceae bacterium]